MERSPGRTRQMVEYYIQCILDEHSVRVWTGFIWLWTGSSYDSCKYGNKRFHSRTGRQFLGQPNNIIFSRILLIGFTNYWNMCNDSSYLPLTIDSTYNVFKILYWGQQLLILLICSISYFNLFLVLCITGPNILINSIHAINHLQFRPWEWNDERARLFSI
jgi:hypothetical protein